MEDKFHFEIRSEFGLGDVGHRPGLVHYLIESTDLENLEVIHV